MLTWLGYIDGRCYHDHGIHTYGCVMGIWNSPSGNFGDMIFGALRPARKWGPVMLKMLKTSHKNGWVSSWIFTMGSSGKIMKNQISSQHFLTAGFFYIAPGFSSKLMYGTWRFAQVPTFDSHRKVKCRRPGLRAWNDFLVRRGNGWKGTSINGYTIDHSISFPQSLRWTRLLRFSAIYLVGGLEHQFYFPIQLGISSSQLINIFQRGGPTTNQIFKCVFLLFFTWGFSGFPDVSLRE